MSLPPDFGWLLAVGLAAQLVDRALGIRYALTVSALLVSLTLNVVLWLQVGRFALESPGALLLGAVGGVPLAAFLMRHLPRRAAVLGVGLAVFAFATLGLQLSLT